MTAMERKLCRSRADRRQTLSLSFPVRCHDETADNSEQSEMRLMLGKREMDGEGLFSCSFDGDFNNNCITNLTSLMIDTRFTAPLLLLNMLQPHRKTSGVEI